jgi:hypothetical protein
METPVRTILSINGQLKAFRLPPLIGAGNGGSTPGRITKPLLPYRYASCPIAALVRHWAPQKTEQALGIAGHNFVLLPHSPFSKRSFEEFQHLRLVSYKSQRYCLLTSLVIQDNLPDGALLASPQS